MEKQYKFLILNLEYLYRSNYYVTMIKIKNNLVGKHTERYIFPILGRNLILIFNSETFGTPREDPGALNLYLRDKKGLNFFGKTIEFFYFKLRIFR